MAGDFTEHTSAAGALPCLLSVPAGAAPHPLLVFLHGFDEAAPLPLRDGVTRHGPLRATNRTPIRDRFMIAAPQLRSAGDHWHRHAPDISALMSVLQREYDADPARTFLTGFSYGGNGVFDLAIALPQSWAALWAVDPTRVPAAPIDVPVWLSFGGVARRAQRAFVAALGLHEADAALAGDRYWRDEGADHVGSAALAYDDPRIYEWLLARHR